MRKNMPKNEWKQVKELKDLLLHEKLKLREIEGKFAVITEKCIQVIESEERIHLMEAYKLLRYTYKFLSVHYPVEVEKEPSFFLGRIVALLEIISAALLRSRPPLFNKLLQKTDYISILDYLLENGQVKHSKLVYYLGSNKKKIIKQLILLREAGLIVIRKLGSEPSSCLSTVGEQALENLYIHKEKEPERLPPQEAKKIRNRIKNYSNWYVKAETTANNKSIATCRTY